MKTLVRYRLNNETRKRMKRETAITVEEFKAMLSAKLIRPATVQDVEGLHHKRNLYKHPNTGQWYVATR